VPPHLPVVVPLLREEVVVEQRLPVLEHLQELVEYQVLVLPRQSLAPLYTD
jgi:hypothetical protein